MARKDILVDLCLHGQTISEFLLETITLTSVETDAEIPQKLKETAGYSSDRSKGRIVRVVVGTTPKGLYMFYDNDDNGTWKKISDTDYVDSTATSAITSANAYTDSSIKENITNGNGVTITPTEKGISVCLNNGEGIVFGTDGKANVNVDTAKGLQISSSKVGINNGMGVTFDENGKVVANIEGGNGITITDAKTTDTDPTKKTISAKVGGGLKVDANGIAVKLKANEQILSIDSSSKELISTLNVVQVQPTTAEPNIREKYEIQGNNGTTIGTIPIYKDSSILSIQMVQATKEGESYTWEYSEEQKKYIISGGTATTSKGEPKYVLGYLYVNADGNLDFTPVDLSEVLMNGEVGDGLIVDANGIISIKLDETSDKTLDETAKYLSLSNDGLKLSGVKTDITTAETNAKTYADTKSTENKTYTDTKSAENKTYTDTKSAEDKAYTDTKISTHTHNGTDSERISYFDLANQPSFNEARQYKTEVLVGSSGVIKANVHQCGTKPIVQCRCGSEGSDVLIDIDVASNGDISWSVTPSFTDTDNAVIVVCGSSENGSSHYDLQDMWFGYTINESESNPRLAVTRIAGSEAYKRAVFTTGGLLDGNLFRYVSKDASSGDEIDITEDIKDFTKFSKYKYGGLNGEDGDRDIFAVPKSQLFFKVEVEGTEVGSRKLTKKISLYHLDGFQPYHKNHNVYIGLYEATNQIKDLEGNTLNKPVSYNGASANGYLCSKAMLDDATAKARYYGGSNNSGNRVGMARTSLSISNFSNLARNKNTDAITDGLYEEMDYMTYLMLYDLFICDFGTLNSQDGVNYERDINGFRQGGLGNGISNAVSWDSWYTYNYRNPIWLSGASTNVKDLYLGSGCGQVRMTNPSGITSTNYECVFHGIENLFGHIFQMVNGLHIIGENSQVSAKCYICNDPTIFGGVHRDTATISQQESIGYIYEGVTPSSAGYQKNAQFGVFGSLLPNLVIDKNSMYFCDYHYTAVRDSLRWCLFGGNAYYGTGAGFGCLGASSGWATASTNVGSRLCFFKRVSDAQ